MKTEAKGFVANAKKALQSANESLAAKQVEIEEIREQLARQDSSALKKMQEKMMFVVEVR